MITEPRSQSPFYRKLSRRMVFILIVVSLTPMILVSGFILNEFRNSYQEKLNAHLAELVLKHTQNINHFLNEKLSDIKLMAASFPFETLRREAFLKERLRLLREKDGPLFEDMGVIDSQGHQLAYAGPFRLEEADYSTAAWFRSAIRSPVYISDVFTGLRGTPHFIVSARNGPPGRHWILRATINFQEFNRLVGNLRVGKTGFAYILNREGQFQTRPMVAGAITRGDRLYQLLKNSPRTARGVHIAEAAAPEGPGDPNIYVGSFLKNEEWLLVYQQNIADAYADLAHTQVVALVLLFIGGVCIVLTAHWVSRRLVARIATADREIEMMNQQVIETGKLAAIGELAAGVAHEINNPVAIMMEEAGWIGDLMKEMNFAEDDNLEELHRALKQISTQGKRCKGITHKLLSFARRSDEEMKDVCIAELIEEVIGISIQQARYSNVTIHTDLQPDLPPLRISPTGFQQVLINLITNALHAMETKGGTLHISARLVRDRVVIDVADTGTGIPRANLSRIFDPFFTTKPVGKGSGLGLSICYGIIRKMGGDIDVRSVMDEGTTFTIKLKTGMEIPPDEAEIATGIDPDPAASPFAEDEAPVRTP